MMTLGGERASKRASERASCEGEAEVRGRTAAGPSFHIVVVAFLLG